MKTDRFYVDLPDGSRIWTLAANRECGNTPIVALHGFLGAIGFWVSNVDTFAQTNPFYAIDILGFGKSSRVKLSEDPARAERELVRSIEAWCKAMNFERIILVGHSFGGFLASAYAMRHANRVESLILIESWGWADAQKKRVDAKRAIWLKIVEKIPEEANFMDLLRSSGNIGINVTKFIRPAYKKIFRDVLNDNDTIYRYIYYANCFYPS